MQETTNPPITWQGTVTDGWFSHLESFFIGTIVIFTTEDLGQEPKLSA